MSIELQTVQHNTKFYASWICTLGLPAILMLLPVNEVFTFQLKVFFAVTLMAILTFVFDNINSTVVAILLPLSYILIVKAPAVHVFNPWSQYIPWMLIGGMILANVLERVGLLKRIAYKCILLTGASYKGIIWGIAGAGLILYIFMPNKTVIPLAAMVYGICISLGLKKGKEAAGLTLAAATAALVPGSFIYNPTFFMYVGLGISVTGPLSIGWVEYFLANIVMALQYVILIFIITKIFKPDAPINGKEFFQAEYDSLGKVSLSEKKSLIVCLLMFGFILTSKWHKIEPAWGFAFIPLLLFFPWIEVGKNEDLQKVNYGMILFTTACMGIGTTAGALGLGAIVSQFATPLIVGKDVTFIMACIYGLSFLLNFLMTPLAIISAFTMPLAQIAVDMGMNPLAMYFLMANALDQIILPYEIVLWLIFVSFGLVEIKHFAKYMSIKVVVNIFFVFALLVPYWKLIGFLYLQ